MVNEGVKQNKVSSRKAKRLAPAKVEPIDTAELREEILRLLRQGSTMTEICAQPHMPSLSTLFYMKRRDPKFDDAFNAAIEDHAAAMISDAMEYAQANADDDREPMDPSDTLEPPRAALATVNTAKSAEFYLNSALKYASAMAPHKFGAQAAKISAEIGHGVSITVTSYATKASEERPTSVENPSS